MADRPIIFSAPMIRALLDGRKTQTRRLAGGKPIPGLYESDGGPLTPILRPSPWQRVQPGDRLWVREAWAPVSACTHNDPGTQALAGNGFYRADESTVEGEIDRWRPSIHMPRWASRLTLTVTKVRVQRLQEISEADAREEGVLPEYAERCIDAGHPWVAVPKFRELWNSLHGPGAWDANPEVVAVSFSVERKNIDG